MSGLLGGALAVAGTQAGRAVLEFGASVVMAAANLEETRNLTRVTFEDATADVERFAQGAASALGLSERAALEAAGAFGTIGQAIGLTDAGSAKFATTLATIAGDLASLRNIPVEEAIQRLQSGLVGETESLRRLGVIIDQDVLKRAAQREGISEGSRELTQQEKILATYAEILRQTEAAQGDFARTSESLPNQMRTLTAEIENAKAAFGELAVPFVADVASSLSDLAFVLGAVGDGLGKLKEAGGGLGVVGDLIEDVFGKITGQDARDALGSLADALGKNEKEATELASTAEVAAGRTKELADASDEAAKKAEQLADAQTRLNRALADSERRVDRAELSLARAFEDAALRINKSERALAEAFEDRSERIADAEQKIIDERLEGFRSVRDARERLADFERDSEQKVIDAEQRIMDLRRQQSRAIVSSLIDVASAMRAGDAEAENRARVALAEAQDTREIAQAEADLTQQKADREREQDRLERDLFEARQDRTRQVKDAQIDLAQTIEDADERIIDAQLAVEDAHRESSRAIFDAQRSVNDAIRDGTEAVSDARKAYDRLADQAEKTRTSLQLLTKEAEKLRDIMLDPVFMDPGRDPITGVPMNPQPANPFDTNPFGTGSGATRQSSAVRGSDGAAQPTIVNMNVQQTDPEVIANILTWRLVQGVS